MQSIYLNKLAITVHFVQYVATLNTIKHKV